MIHLWAVTESWANFATFKKDSRQVETIAEPKQTTESLTSPLHHLLKPQKELIARWPRSIPIHLLNPLIINDMRSEIRVHRCDHKFDF